MTTHSAQQSKFVQSYRDGFEPQVRVSPIRSKILGVAKRLKAIALEVAGFFPVSAVALFRLRNPTKTDPNQPLVLMVHGFLGSSPNWLYVRNSLAREGIHNIFTIDLGSPFHPIEEYAAMVAKQIEEMKRISGRNDIILVGHSMGGLIIDAYLKLYANKSPQQSVRVLDVVTVGTPVTGTWVALIASLFSKCARQMLPSSDFSRNRNLEWTEILPNGAKVTTKSFKKGGKRVWEQITVYPPGTSEIAEIRRRRTGLDGRVYEVESQISTDGKIRMTEVDFGKEQGPEKVLRIASKYDTIVPFYSASHVEQDLAEGVDATSEAVGNGGHIWQMVSGDIRLRLASRILSTIHDV